MSELTQRPPGGGGGIQVQKGAAPLLRISRRKGSFFKTSACPRFCKRRVLFCTRVRSMGVKIPLGLFHLKIHGGGGVERPQFQTPPQ